MKTYVPKDDLQNVITLEFAPEQQSVFDEAEKSAQEAVTKAAMGAQAITGGSSFANGDICRRTRESVAGAKLHNPETCRDPACDCFPF